MLSPPLSVGQQIIGLPERYAQIVRGTPSLCSSRARGQFRTFVQIPGLLSYFLMHKSPSTKTKKNYVQPLKSF